MIKQFGQTFRNTLAVAMLFAVISLAGVAQATEGGGGAYPNGAEDFMAGAVPPPGNYFINYFNYYSADKFKGNNGPPNLNLKVSADVLRFIKVTDTKILGGFWGMHMFIPLVQQDVKVVPVVDESRRSLGDIIIDPFILSWHGANWHAATGVDIFLPTGNYMKSHNVNIGRNYWTVEPIAALTLLPGAGFDISAKLMYDINTKNKDSNYLSGQELHADFAVGKKVDAFTAGLAGYLYKQITDDEANGVKVNGNKGQVVAFGPALKYDYKNMSLTLKYMFETEVKNRPSGDNFWFKFLYAF